MKCKTRGFTLIELLIVVAIIGIIVTITVPGLLRARMSGNEAEAIKALRAINSAQSTFASSCGFGFYAPSLAQLGTPPTVGGGDGFIGTALAADPAERSGYVVTFVPGPRVSGTPVSCNGVPSGETVATYFVYANPNSGAGVRYFGTNQGGTVYQSTAPVAVTQSGAPANATPIP